MNAQKTVRPRVCFVFDNMTEFNVMKAFIAVLKKHDTIVDIYVPEGSGYNGLDDYTVDSIKQAGYKVYSEPKGTKYQIAFLPYDSVISSFSIKFEYKIRYLYGMGIASKPDPGDSPEWSLPFDAQLSFSQIQFDTNSALTKQLLVPPLHYKGFEKRLDKKKKTVLYLPTFGESSYINETASALKQLRKEYRVITKAHHSTQFNRDGADQTQVLRDNSDEYYDQNISIMELLEHADVVLSDNSGAIFDALYTGTPVAIFADDLNLKCIGKFNTMQYELVKKGLLNYTDNPELIPDVVRKAIKDKDVIQYVSNDVLGFVPLDNHSEEDFYQSIRYYLYSDRTEDRYLALHDVLRDEYHNLIVERYNLRKQIEDINHSISMKVTSPLRAGKKIIRKIIKQS